MVLSFEINPYILLAALVMLCAFVYRYMKENYSYLEKLGIPGPKPVWVFGNVLEFKNKNVLDVFDSWTKKYGKIYGFYEGFRPGIVVNDPEFAKDILNKHFDKFYIRPSYRPFMYYPDDLRLISIDGEHWKNQRAILNKMLNSNTTLKNVVSKVQKASFRMLERIDNERKACIQGLNISNFVDKFTSEAVMRVVLDMGEAQIEQHGEAVHRYELESNRSASAENEVSGLARLFPSLTPFLKFADKTHKESHTEMVQLLREYLTSTIESGNNNAMTEADHPSLLSYLNSSKVLSRDIDGSLTRRGLNTDETIAHILSLLSEVYSTTTATLQFLLYEMARNPECQEKILHEISMLFCKDDEITLSKLQKMEYFEKFFFETYRTHPVAPGVSRVCAEDCKLQGVTFKKGMVVRVMTSTMYNNETIFANPEKFDPERFSQKNREDRHQYSFLPFGQGPRMCPGQKLAFITIKTCVISILNQYIITTNEHTEIPLKNALRPSLCPKNGVHISLTPRHSSL